MKQKILKMCKEVFNDKENFFISTKWCVPWMVYDFVIAVYNYYSDKLDWAIFCLANMVFMMLICKKTRDYIIKTVKQVAGNIKEK